MSKTLITMALATGILMAAGSSHARDDKKMMPIAELMSQEKAKEKIDPAVRLVFAGQSHSAPTRNFGNYVTNKKTNAFNKSDTQACEWVMLSAVIALQDRAKAEGGNAVINIESYYKKNVMASATEYECHVGKIIAGVALRGDVVTLP